jgi:hypothetical protein
VPFAALREERNALGAARGARTLSWLHLNVCGVFVVSAGWLARAERLLADAADGGAEYGWIELMSAERARQGTLVHGRRAAAGRRALTQRRSRPFVG